MDRLSSCGGDDKEKLIMTAWKTTIVFVFSFIIAAIALAAKNDSGEAGTSRSDGFAAIWAMLLIIGLTVGGSLVLKRHRKPLAIGFFLGVCIMMSVNMLTLFAIFVGLAHDASAASTDASADNAAAAFAFLLCLCYGVFSFILSKNKDELVAGNFAEHKEGGVAGEQTGDSAVSV